MLVAIFRSRREQPSPPVRANVEKKDWSPQQDQPPSSTLIIYLSSHTGLYHSHMGKDEMRLAWRVHQYYAKETPHPSTKASSYRAFLPFQGHYSYLQSGTEPESPSCRI